VVLFFLPLFPLSVEFFPPNSKGREERQTTHLLKHTDSEFQNIVTVLGRAHKRSLKKYSPTHSK
jgi:hypothetical protein